MYLMLGLVICAFIPAVLYCIPLDREVGVYMTSKDDVGQKDNELDIGYDRSKPNPEELGGHFEGDIVLPREMDRNGLTSSKYRWPNGVLPYVIKGNYTVNETGVIKKAVELYHKYTCLTFREKLPSDEDYFAIVSSDIGCWSNIGRQGGMQVVNLQAPDCVRKVGTAAHEFMHIAGFVHEVSRYDRDEYVEINWDNVREDVGQQDNELEIGYDGSKSNPEERGGYFEGDIVLPREMDRNGLTNPKYRWPNGVLPYVIEGNYTVNETQVIKKAMELYHKYTCLTFREKLPSDKDYISIISSENGCWAPLGRQDGMQQVSLEAPKCLVEVGTVVHELMHVVGFVHEVNRYDRDEYVEINWGNILKGQEHNFKIRREGEINDYGVSYDYNSVMHYSNVTFAENRDIPSVIAKDVSKAKNMGQRDGFSIKDITKVNAMYNCSEKTQVARDVYNKSKPGVAADEYIFSE